MMDCLTAPRLLRAPHSWLTVLLLIVPNLAHAQEKPATLPTVAVTSVAVEDDSVKVTINAASAPTATDFRIMDVSNPTTVKYFGQWHITAGWPGNDLQFAMTTNGKIKLPLHTVAGANGQSTNATATVPAWEVQWNGLTPGKAVTLVVQAVDAVGPFAPGNLYDTTTDAPLEACTNGMCMLGSDRGLTLDGLESINGQGPSTNLPNVIAQSAPFTITPGVNTVPIPSGSDATQSLMERFTSATLTPVATLLPGVDEASWKMTTGATGSIAGHAWDVEAHNIDANLTRPFVADSHFMDVSSDGGTIGKSSNPPHTAHGSISISPQQTVSFANGQILHITGEWDSHQDLRRWTGISVFPATDRAISQFPLDTALNTSDQAYLVELEQDTINFEDCLGRQTAANPNSLPTVSLLSGDRPYIFGHKLKATVWNSNLGPTPNPPPGAAYFQIGRGFDNRSRYDLFLSQTHAAFYEDGTVVADYNLPQALTFSTAKIYFTHYLYHLALDHTELAADAPWETFWLNTVPYSDERHWDDCGYEVLPAATPWNTLKMRCQPVAATAVP